jgi:hypothetical protein
MNDGECVVVRMQIVVEGWDGGWLIVPNGERFGWEERTRAMVEHGGGELAHESFCLAAEHTDDVVVNAAA